MSGYTGPGAIGFAGVVLIGLDHMYLGLGCIGLAALVSIAWAAKRF